MKKLLAVINIIVIASLFAYLLKLSANNFGFFWRAMLFTLIFSSIALMVMYKRLHKDINTFIAITGVLCAFMFIFVVAGTNPIDGIWCLYSGKPLINPNSCGGGVVYQSLWAALFGAHDSYTPLEPSLCKFNYVYREDSKLCIREQLGFYEYLTSDGQRKFDSTTLILNLGWVLFPLGALFGYLGYLKSEDG